MKKNGQRKHADKQIPNKQMPRAVVHKKILDAAESEPEWSIADLAKEVNGASEMLVERVLDKYGDPANDENDESMTEDKDTIGDEENPKESKEVQVEESDHAGDTSDTSIPTTEAAVGNNKHSTSRKDLTVETDNNILVDSTKKNDEVTTDLKSSTKTGDRNESPVQDLEQLTEKQLKVLRAIYERPNATQAELAEKFGISRATISQRVNRINGFEWRNRKEFVEEMFNGNKIPMDSQKNSRHDVEQVTFINELTDRMDTLEQRVEEATEPNRSAFSDSELTAKVIRACIEFDRITEDEEVKIITNLMDSGNNRP